MEIAIGFVYLIFSLIIWALLMGLVIALYILQGVPMYKLAKKMNYQHAWMAWIPMVQPIFCNYMMMKISGKEKFQLGTFTMNNKTAFWIYVLLSILAPVPGVASATAAVASFVYTRDLADCFVEDQEKTRNTLLILVLLDALVTVGLARACYLWRLMKEEPLYVPGCEYQQQ